jgi:putative ABC transport system substrate-binding protein
LHSDFVDVRYWGVEQTCPANASRSAIDPFAISRGPPSCAYTDRADGLVIGTDGFFISRSEQLAELALRYRIPSIFQYRAFAKAGGLISYGSSFSDTYYQLGLYTGRLLKGEKPADLPVQQSTKVELIINLKTARMLGITVPLPLSGRADEVIE